MNAWSWTNARGKEKIVGDEAVACADELRLAWRQVWGVDMSDRFSSQLRTPGRVSRPSGGVENSAPGGEPPDGPGAPGPAGPGGRKPALAIVGALLIAVALGSAAFFSLGGGDSISDAETADRQQQYDALIAGSPMPLELVRADQVEGTITDMPITEEQKTVLREQVASGETRLAWLTLWDTHDEDGDVLRFESDSSVPVEVKALNAPTTLAIPLPASGLVHVTGVFDGGGGITIALKSGVAEIAWPTMQTGDSLDLPVRPGP